MMQEIRLDCVGGARHSLADTGNGVAVHQERDGYHVTLVQTGQYFASFGDGATAHSLANELRSLHDWTRRPGEAVWVAAWAAVRRALA